MGWIRAEPLGVLLEDLVQTSGHTPRNPGAVFVESLHDKLVMWATDLKRMSFFWHHHIDYAQSVQQASAQYLLRLTEVLTHVEWILLTAKGTNLLQLEMDTATKIDLPLTPPGVLRYSAAGSHPTWPVAFRGASPIQLLDALTLFEGASRRVTLHILYSGLLRITAPGTGIRASIDGEPAAKQPMSARQSFPLKPLREAVKPFATLEAGSLLGNFGIALDTERQTCLLGTALDTTVFQDQTSNATYETLVWS
tara:strand:+ start:334 stop:1089 length:756 start_codon:yes stop_codon:yes gene_type:complete